MAISTQSESVTITGSSYYNIKPTETNHAYRVHDIGVSNNSSAVNLASLHMCNGSTIIHKETLNYNGCFDIKHPLLCNSSGVYYRITNNSTRDITAMMTLERQINNPCAMI